MQKKIRILFLAHHKWPHIGGVEKHTDKISKGVNSKNINLSTFAKGIYTLVVNSQNGKAVYKVVVE